jgi:hypothetical protein
MFAPGKEGEYDRKMMAQTSDLIIAAMDDAGVVEDIPHGSVLILIPPDDPEFAEETIAVGLRAVRQGHNVYFKHWPVNASGEASETRTEGV